MRSVRAVDSGDKVPVLHAENVRCDMLLVVSGPDCGTVPAEKSEDAGKQSVKLTRQGKPGVVQSHGRLTGGGARKREVPRSFGVAAIP
jgi:hypothetical protein